MTVAETGSGPGALMGATYWLISNGPAGVLKLDLDGLGRTLPVFSFKEEAEMFLALDGMGDGWRSGESGAGDLYALFLDVCADVESVVLDPLPAMLHDGTAGLVGLSLGRFVDRFLGPDTPGPGGPESEREPG